MADFSTVQAIKRVSTIDTIGRRPLNIGLMMAAQDGVGDSREWSIERSLLERIDLRRNIHSRWEIPFAFITQMTRDSRRMRRGEMLGGVTRAVDITDTDDDSPLDVDYSAANQLEIDPAMAPLLSRFQIRTGATGHQRVAWFSGKPSVVTIGDAATITHGDFEVSGETIQPITMAIGVDLGRAAYNFDPGVFGDAMASAMAVLLRAEITEQVLIGTGASNHMTGVSRKSGITTVNHTPADVTTVGSEATHAITLDRARDVFNDFMLLRGAGGVGGNLEPILVASTQLHVQLYTILIANTDRYLWQGGPVGRFVDLCDAYWIPEFEVPAHDVGMTTVAAYSQEGLFVHPSAVIVQFWGDSLALEERPSATSSEISLQMVASVNVAVINVANNAMLTRKFGT